MNTKLLVRDSYFVSIVIDGVKWTAHFNPNTAVEVVFLHLNPCDKVEVKNPKLLSFFWDKVEEESSYAEF